MKSPFLILVFSFFLIPPTSGIHAQNISATIDSVVQRYASVHPFSGVILAADQGKIIYQQAFGVADLDTGVKLTIDSRFRIASITKAITAVVIMQLTEEEKFSLETSVTKLLPEFKDQIDPKITIHHLLLHISGLPNERDELYAQSRSAREMISSTLQNGLQRGKKDSFNYNNIDYLLLHLIIEETEGKSWIHVFRERIIDPLKLSNTGFINSDTELPKGYLISEEGSFMPEPIMDISNYGAAAAMYSTVDDLLVFDQALYGDKLLTSSSIEAMYTSYPEFGYVAYGNWVYNYPFGEGYPKIVERRGGILGFNHVLVRFTELNKTLIILSNNNHFNPDSFGDENNLKEQLIKVLSKSE